jgi:hypothetical protein
MTFSHTLQAELCAARCNSTPESALDTYGCCQLRPGPAPTLQHSASAGPRGPQYTRTCQGQASGALPTPHEEPVPGLPATHTEEIPVSCLKTTLRTFHSPDSCIHLGGIDSEGHFFVES